MTIEIDTGKKTINLNNLSASNWGHVEWIINNLRQNGRMLWGEPQKEQKSATILKLVKPEEKE